MADPPLPGGAGGQGLAERLRELAATERLLVATDFDGVLARLVDDPMTSRPVEGAVEVVEELAALPGVTVAVVSGRDLDTLHRLSGVSGDVVLIGSHGAQTSWREVPPLPEGARALLAALDAELQALLQRHPGARLERKPTSRVVHTRGLPADRARAALDEVAVLAARHTGVVTTPGKDVLELAVVQAGKGPAMTDLAAARGAGALLYAGDDVTDERAFEHLGRCTDLQVVRVKVGPGESAAEHRVADEAAMVQVLRELARLRLT